MNELNNIFNKEITNSVILHIPHSSINIPMYDGFLNKELLSEDISIHTDWFVDKIFDLNFVKVVPNFSRIFCDVERLKDKDEDFYRIGRGFFYTHTYQNIELRKNINGIKKYVFRNYYVKHQNNVNKLIERNLNKYNQTVILDCHSFDKKSIYAYNNESLPDICIGVDEYHTPNYLVDYIVNLFKGLNLKLSINYPFKG